MATFGKISVPDLLNSQYQVIGKLGQGGMGLVIEAHDTRLDRRVAIKVVTAEHVDEEDMQRFEREIKVATQVGNHPNAVQVYGAFVGQVCIQTGLDQSVEERPYFVMEHVKGEDLEQRLRKGPVPLSDLRTIADQTGEVIHYMHKQGLVNRDIKPSNIMLTTDIDGQLIAKIMDLGLGKVAVNPEQSLSQGDLTQDGDVIGTPSYMPPEQITDSRTLSHLSDQYALGATWFKVLTGKNAFIPEAKWGPVQVMDNIMTGNHVQKAIATLPESLEQYRPGEFNSETTKRLQECLATAMAAQVGDRYQTTKTFTEDLVSIFDEALESYEPTRIDTTERLPGKRRSSQRTRKLRSSGSHRTRKQSSGRHSSIGRAYRNGQQSKPWYQGAWVIPTLCVGAVAAGLIGLVAVLSGKPKDNGNYGNDNGKTVAVVPGEKTPDQPITNHTQNGSDNGNLQSRVQLHIDGRYDQISVHRYVEQENGSYVLEHQGIQLTGEDNTLELSLEQEGRHIVKVIYDGNKEAQFPVDLTQGETTQAYWHAPEIDPNDINEERIENNLPPLTERGWHWINVYGSNGEDKGFWYLEMWTQTDQARFAAQSFLPSGQGREAGLRLPHTLEEETLFSYNGSLSLGARYPPITPNDRGRGLGLTRDSMRVLPATGIRANSAKDPVNENAFPYTVEQQQGGRTLPQGWTVDLPSAEHLVALQSPNGVSAAQVAYAASVRRDGVGALEALQENGPLSDYGVPTERGIPVHMLYDRGSDREGGEYFYVAEPKTPGQPLTVVKRYGDNDRWISENGWTLVLEQRRVH